MDLLVQLHMTVLQPKCEAVHVPSLEQRCRIQNRGFYKSDKNSMLQTWAEILVDPTPQRFLSLVFPITTSTKNTWR